MFLSTRAKTAAVLTATASMATLLGGATAAHAIVGGEAVTAASYNANYKSVVDIDTGGKSPSGKTVKCVGVLIAPTKVVTSFNCVSLSDGGLQTTKVTGGRKDLTGTDGTVSGVTDIEYDANMQYTEDGVPVNDVAVFTLAKKMPYTPVKLVPTSFKYTAGTKARIVGWGDSGNGTSNSNQLKEGKIEILPDASCEKAYTTNNFQSNAMVCGGEKKGGVDFSGGDEGAPLFVTQGDQQYLAGIASWGYKEAGRADHPGVYARMSAFRWVTQ